MLMTYQWQGMQVLFNKRPSPARVTALVSTTSPAMAALFGLFAAERSSMARRPSYSLSKLQTLHDRWKAAAGWEFLMCQKNTTCHTLVFLGHLNVNMQIYWLSIICLYKFYIVGPMAKSCLLPSQISQQMLAMMIQPFRCIYWILSPQ